MSCFLGFGWGFLGSFRFKVFFRNLIYIVEGSVIGFRVR